MFQTFVLLALSLGVFSQQHLLVPVALEEKATTGWSTSELPTYLFSIWKKTETSVQGFNQLAALASQSKEAAKFRSGLSDPIAYGKPADLDSWGVDGLGSKPETGLLAIKLELADSTYQDSEVTWFKNLLDVSDVLEDLWKDVKEVKYLTTIKQKQDQVAAAKKEVGTLVAAVFQAHFEKHFRHAIARHLKVEPDAIEKADVVEEPTVRMVELDSDMQQNNPTYDTTDVCAAIKKAHEVEHIADVFKGPANGCHTDFSNKGIQTILDKYNHVINIWVALEDVEASPLGFMTGKWEHSKHQPSDANSFGTYINTEADRQKDGFRFKDMAQGDFVIFNSMDKWHCALPIAAAAKCRVSTELRVGVKLVQESVDF